MNDCGGDNRRLKASMVYARIYDSLLCTRRLYIDLLLARSHTSYLVLINTQSVTSFYPAMRLNFSLPKINLQNNLAALHTLRRYRGVRGLLPGGDELRLPVGINRY